MCYSASCILCGFDQWPLFDNEPIAIKNKRMGLIMKAVQITVLVPSGRMCVD